MRPNTIVDTDTATLIRVTSKLVLRPVVIVPAVLPELACLLNLSGAQVNLDGSCSGVPGLGPERINRHTGESIQDDDLSGGHSLLFHAPDSFLRIARCLSDGDSVNGTAPW